MAQVLTRDGSPAVAEIDDRSFRRLTELVHDDCGIALGDGKRNLVVSRLGRRLRDLGLTDFDAYCSLLESAGGHDERRRLTGLLTTNVTRFFREAHHFEALENQVLPPLLQRAKAGGRVRIWSAGCSSGQEPYSIAATILGLMPQAGQYDIRILGTDIDTDMIRKGRTGIYWDVNEAEIPQRRFRKMFRSGAEAGGRRIAPEVQALVTLAELNLMKDWPMRGRFDVIFCRNVVIYFDGPTQARLWSRFAGVLASGGYLFVGHSERVSGPAEAQFTPAGVTGYRRR